MTDTEDNALSDEELMGRIARSDAQAFEILVRHLQRLAVVLKKFDGLSYDEISRILGCSKSAVESLLVRAKRNLCEKLLLNGLP